ncbi:MAG: glycosyltransferase family 39 protein [bacterium]|nr:glycosyltransferase family 39 protein [bacterium]
MPAPEPRAQASPPGALLAVAVAATALIGARLWEGDLHQDQVLYAAVAERARTGGDWLHLHFGDDPYWKKPPLMFWAVAAFFELLGPTALAARLVPAALGVATCVLVAALGRRLFGEPAGLLAGLALATTPPFFRNAAALSLDPAVGAGTLAALLCWLRGVEHGRRRDFVLAGVAFGLVVLAKGTFGLLAPFVLVLWCLTHGRRRDLASPGVLLSALVATAIFLPWHLEQLRTYGPDFLRVYLGQEVLERAVGNLELGVKPVSYPLTLLRDAAPWVPSMLLGVWLALRRARGGDRAARFVLAWALGYLALITLSAGQRPQYLLPLYPATSLLAGLGTAALLPAAWTPHLPRVVAIAFAALGVALCVLPITIHRPRYDALRALGPLLPPDGTPLVGFRTSLQLRAASQLYLGRDLRPRRLPELRATSDGLVLAERSVAQPLVDAGFVRVHANERYVLLRSPPGS